MIDKLKCFFGFHNFSHRYYANKHGKAVGLCCRRCGMWSDKNSKRGSWDELGECGDPSERVYGDLWLNAKRSGSSGDVTGCNNSKEASL